MKLTIMEMDKFIEDTAVGETKYDYTPCTQLTLIASIYTYTTYINIVREHFDA